jgi:hypothetical protein
VCTWYQQVVHVRAQLQRSDGVSTVAYCLLNAEHGSLKVGFKDRPCAHASVVYLTMGDESRGVGGAEFVSNWP